MGNYLFVSNLPVMGKLIEEVVAEQLEAFLDETSALDPFHSDFRLGFETEPTLLANKICGRV